MEFTNRHSQRPTPSAKPPSHLPRAARSVRTSPPTVKEAVKASGKMIRVAFSHATKATLHEAKELYKLTEEGFDLDENPRWQKFRSQAGRLARKLRLPKLPRKMYVAIVCVLVVGLVSTTVYRLTVKTAPPKQETKAYTSNKLEKGTPTYATLLPAGKTIESLGGWTRVSPPTSSPVYAFGDRVDGVAVIVSEQPLPDTLKNGSLEEFAKAYSAEHKVTVSGTDIYIGTSAKGPQSAVLTKNNLLILIKTDSKMTDAQWANYVGSFK